MSLSKTLRRRSFSFASLLATLVALILAAGFTGTRFGATAVSVVFSLVLVAGVLSLYPERRQRLAALALLVPALAGWWSIALWPHTGTSVLASACAALFLAFVAGALLRFILRQASPTRDTIYGGICIYLLLGLLWAHLYALGEILAPGSLNMPPLAGDSHGELVAQLTYFSFITLTTLGYGEITPVSAPMRSLVIVETLVGQMFIAVFIARLVGMPFGTREDRPEAETTAKEAP
jgi:hypothetical protein